MLKRLRQLKISLAAKCQLLFGAAVVLIISAALFVPWRRMEQLTDQLNQRAAAATARAALADHVIQERLRPGTRIPATTMPSLRIDGIPVLPPRIISLASQADSKSVSVWERAVMLSFIRDRNLKFKDRTYETTESNEGGYRYAEPLFAAGVCTECHLQPPDTFAAKAPSTAPSTMPAFLGIVSVDIPSQVSTPQLLLNRVFILTAGLIAGTLAIIIFYLVTTRLILQPVRVLQETAQRVSEGDLNIRSDINTGDEFQVLSETFNTMLANLKDSADQLRAVNKSLDLRLGQLAESNVALYESNRLKSEFLANVSHELRTPLNSILGFAELLKELTLPANEPKIVRYIQNIVTAGHNLLDLINDLLDLAKIEAGRMEVRSEPLSLVDLFEALVGVLKPLTEAKSVTITPLVAPDVPIIETDPAKLQQILYNFLSNAIKFSPTAGRIELAAQLVDQRVRISVTDHGPGIEQTKHSMIFEKFRQIDGSVTREHSGTGLGLAISKDLSGLLGGSIGLESQLGAGATFYVLLPLKIAATHADLRGRIALV